MRNHHSPPLSDYYGQILALALGALIGFGGAFLFSLFDIAPSDDMEKARALGIVSLTTMEGHSKFKDIANYVVLLVLPVACSAGLWHVWVRMRHVQAAGFLGLSEDTQFPKNRRWVWTLLFVGVMYGAELLHLQRLHETPFYLHVGAWPFLGEEGAFLAWVQAIHAGGVLGRDFSCIYGPLIVYPLAWAMNLFGVSVFTARLYTLILNLLAYLIILYFLYRTMKLKTSFLFSALGFLAIFLPNWYLAPHHTFLRVTLGTVPILILSRPAALRSRRAVMLAGFAVGVSVMFSQEVGLSSLIAVSGMHALAYIVNKDQTVSLRALLLFMAGAAIAVLPFSFYFFMHNALVPAIREQLVVPRLLGAFAIPFPPLKYFLAQPFSDMYLFYWIIGVYIFSAISLIPPIMARKLEEGQLLKTGLLIFGAVLFKSVLARSDQYHALFASQPAFLLLFLHLDNAAVTVLAKNNRERAFINSLLVAGLGLSVVVLFLVTSILRIHMAGRFNRDRLNGRTMAGIRADSIIFDERVLSPIARIKTFLAQHTRDGDPVFFFPNEPAYYFLFNRNNPTRYSGGMAATAQQRNEMVSALENTKPRYVVYSRTTWRIDDISEEIQAPQLVQYLQKNYHEIESSGDVQFLQRNADCVGGTDNDE